jgi:hypothetical protein
MNKQAMISIHPEHAYNILIGKKTLEIRKWIPKDYVGWVHMYVTKGKPYLYQIYNRFIISDFKGKSDFKDNFFNNKVVAKFWFEGYEQIRWNNDLDICFTMKMSQKKLLNDLQLTKEELISYVQDKIGYAWHINKLTIFDKPRELGDYFTDYDIFDTDRNGKYVGEYIQPTKLLTKAPQRLTWVYEANIHDKEGK